MRPHIGHSLFFARSHYLSFIQVSCAPRLNSIFASKGRRYLSKNQSDIDVGWRLSQIYCDLFAVGRIAIGLAVVRLFSLLMICVLALSHGTAGMAVPHEHELELHGSGHEDSAMDVLDVSGDPAALDRDQSGFPVDGEVSHSHVSADAPFRTASIDANRFTKAAHPRPLPSRQLDSANPSPLLEPPLI